MPAQTLARPGWVGSGIGAEPWWHGAVFYRIDVAHFQDSDGDGIGDLGGIAQRLDYLQSLGVDAVVIAAPDNDKGFDDLLHEASARHVRIVMAFDSHTPVAEVAGRTRQWLTRGAAGISIDASLAGAPLHDLRALTDSFPGERVLLLQSVPGQSPPTPNSAKLTSVAVAIPTTAASLQFLTAEPPAASSRPLLARDSGSPASDAAREAGMQKIVAAELLTSRGAVLLVYGQELGLSGAATMQWTPTNVTPPKAAPEAEEAAAKPAAAPPDPNVYGTFKPYVAPKPVKKPPPPGTPPNPNTLPGFTTKTDGGNAATTTANVALEDAEPASLLNFYRRLVQLHHDNPTVRSGAQVILNHDAENALVWVRREPAGAVTAGNVVVTCNMSDKPITLSLDQDFVSLHIHPGTLRPLLGSWTATPISQYSNHIVLPAYSVFVGEIRN